MPDRPDGSVMDPASGEDHASFPALTRAMVERGQWTGYAATGISVVLDHGPELKVMNMV